MYKLLLISWILGSLFTSSAISQTWNIDSLARSVPSQASESPEAFARYLKEQFPDAADRVAALFLWIGNTITYDNSQAESMSRFETIDDFVLFTLRHKKAVCQGYAEVFSAVCNGMGIQALTVHGYTKVDGRLKSELGHAWNIARIDGKWYLFDPTWGSGYLENGRYRKSFSAFYFMTPPDSLIGSHMPFDPIWQLREYPITHDQFLEGRGHGPIYYDFTDSLNLYFSLDEAGRAESTLRRAEATHAKRQEIQKMYRKYCNYLLNLKCNSEISRYNESSNSLKNAIDRFNEYQEIKIKRNPDRIRQRTLLEAARLMVQQSLLQAQSITPCSSLSIQEIQHLIKQINEVDTAISTSIFRL